MRVVHWLEQRGGSASMRDLCRARLAGGSQSATDALKLVDALVDRGLARKTKQLVHGGGETTTITLAALESSENSNSAATA